MLLMFVVRVIDVVVRAVRLMASGSLVGTLLATTVVVLFRGGMFGAIVGGAWLLAELQNNYGLVDAVLPCPFTRPCGSLT